MLDGFLIPKYECIKLLGEGRTSYVWMCRRKGDGLLVAVKIPKEGEEAGKSFIVEIANWDRLKHLNVVELYDYNIHPYPYAEMELCDCSLADVKLDHLELAVTLARVLDYAHSEGVIHGDLKPSNILLKEGVIKVCDWGMGFTPAYAPPEVLDGNKPDERADVWSYGVVLYEHITGTNPFQGRDDIETYRKVFEVEPDFSGLGSLKNIVEKCLRKDPKERYQSFSEIKRELANTSITVYSRRFSMSRGKDRLRNLLMLVDSYELAGDIKTAKERIDDGIAIIKDEVSRKILEAMNIFMDIKETCLKAIYEDRRVKAELMWMKFDNFLSYLDDRTRQIVENDPYAGQIIRYIKTVCTDTLTMEELKKIYYVVCERIPHLLRSLL
jgi:serine/threonine protein kinase